MSEATRPVKEVLLILADISGYTKFMIANSEELEHSQEIISLLMQAIIDHVQLPIQISKLEGDAVFLYATKDDNWETKRDVISLSLLNFVEVFRAKLRELVATVECRCGACKNIDILKLKLIVHSGKALLYTLGNFNELSGLDVIIAHRLLKNSVPSHEYILLTERAFQEQLLPEGLQLEVLEENVDDIGSIKTYVLYM